MHRPAFFVPFIASDQIKSEPAIQLRLGEDQQSEYLFIIGHHHLYWGGRVLSLFSLDRHPDATAGQDASLRRSRSSQSSFP